MAGRSQKSKPVRRDRFINTYDEIPQPKGEFKDLFEEMRAKSAAKNERSSSRQDTSKK
ncbi:MAG: hypothetical protein OXD31_12385 [Chloroflexi bacterium]|nr:hypothetical protein [Chloroflexota bacterium]